MTDEEADLPEFDGKMAPWIVNGIPSIGWRMAEAERQDLTEPAIAEEYLADESDNVQTAEPFTYEDFFHQVRHSLASVRRWRQKRHGVKQKKLNQRS